MTIQDRPRMFQDRWKSDYMHHVLIQRDVCDEWIG